MKKSLLALACALFVGQGLLAQTSQEVTYVEDPSQGYLFNQFKDNWFVSAEVGGNVFFSPSDSHRDFWDRWEPAASIYVGKWFSPIIGLRAGVNWLKVKGLSDIQAPGVLGDEPLVDGKYKQKFVHLGPSFDAMLNLTNWFCGYKPGRFYNLTVYGGVGFYFTLARQYDADNNASSYKDAKDNILAARGGIINSFNLSKSVQLSLDVRFTALDNHRDQAGGEWNKTAYDLSAYLGVTYLFPKREWNAPIVPVCPEPENCDALRARLQAADARIADLEAQLQACLDRPTEVVEAAPAAPLATIYFPINVSKLTKSDVRVVNACAEVMKANPDTKYVVTGWADNYTGNDRINVNLRKNRAASVEKQLLKAGVPADQFNTTINNGNLVDMGEKFVALDRAATIQVAE
ncbi:MAG: OmpA family protein [Bacteroidales bacterium]|nr:OmpA family protein [Bacteroidales bacterium]